jgi:DNA-directed RNA polymerase beta subunit
MYHGHTGKQLPQRIFLGMAYYQRLKHNADDKIQARSRGPLEMLTRQATHGIFCFIYFSILCCFIF